MKRLIFLIWVLFAISLFAQPRDTLKTYYYFNNNRINLPINTQNFVVYFDLSETTKSKQSRY